MVLEYLDFDHSEDADGAGSWDAMACVLPERLAPAVAEAQAVLAWAHAAFGPPRGEVAELGEWDFALHCGQDGGHDLHAAFNAATGQLVHGAARADGGRCTLTLTLSGTRAFGEALAEHFPAP